MIAWPYRPRVAGPLPVDRSELWACIALSCGHCYLVSTQRPAPKGLHCPACARDQEAPMAQRRATA